MESHDLALWTGFTGFTGWNGNQYPVYPVNPVKIFDFSNDLGKLLPIQCLRDSLKLDNISIIGRRRTGKTVLVKQIIDHLS